MLNVKEPPAYQPPRDWQTKCSERKESTAKIITSTGIALARRFSQLFQSDLSGSDVRVLFDLSISLVASFIQTKNIRKIGEANKVNMIGAIIIIIRVF